MALSVEDSRLVNGRHAGDAWHARRGVVVDGGEVSTLELEDGRVRGEGLKVGVEFLRYFRTRQDMMRDTLSLITLRNCPSLFLQPMLVEKRRESRSFQEHGMLGNLKPAPGILGVGVVDAIAIFVVRRIDQRKRDFQK